MSTIANLQLRVDVSPRMKPTIAFMQRHAWAFGWLGTKLIGWVLCRLFVRVSAR